MSGTVVVNAPPVLVHDGYGRSITSVTDGYAQRLSVDAKVQGTVSIGNPLPDNLIQIVRGFVTNAGSKDMNVDGSGVPVVFTFDADPSVDFRISELRIVISASELKFEGNKFGDAGELPNGILLEVTSSGDTVELSNVQKNEEFLLFPSPTILLDTAGSQDILTIIFPLGIILEAGSGDNVKVTIRDNCTQALKSINFFQGAITGDKV